MSLLVRLGALLAMILAAGCARPIGAPGGPSTGSATAAPGGTAAPEPMGPLTRTDPGCPAAVPAAGAACTGSALRCGYTDEDHHGLVFECYLGHWGALYTTAGACDGLRPLVCPAALGPPPPGLPASYTRDHADEIPCGACLYAGAVSCGYSPLDSGPYCRGIPPEPSPLDAIAAQWRCSAVGDFACRAGAVAGAPCEPDGVSCGRTCCGAAATCTAGHWRVAPRCPPIP